jgi:hypothetical protein
MNKKTIFILIILFFVANIIADTTWNKEDINTWNEANEEQIKTITSEEIYSAWKENPEIIEELFKKFNEEDLKKALEKRLFEIYETEIKVKNLESSQLTLKEGIISDKKGARFNINNFPEDLKSISYDPEKGFTYSFEEGSFTTDIGYLDKDKILNGIEKYSGMNNKIKYLSGEVSYKEWKVSLIDEHSEVILEDQKYSKGELTDKPSYLAMVQEGLHVASNVKVHQEKSAILNIPEKQTTLVFKEAKIPKEMNQYIQLYDNQFKAEGEGISANLLKDFDQVSIKSEEGITIYVGEDNNYPIEFVGEETRIPTQIQQIPHKISILSNENDIEKYFSIKQDSNGVSYIEDHQKLFLAGNVYVNFRGDQMQIQNRLTAFEGTGLIGVVDYKEIPEGLTREEFGNWIRDNVEYKQFEATIHLEGGIDSGRLEMAIANQRKKLITDLNGFLDIAEEYNLLSISQQLGYLEGIDLTDRQELEKAVDKKFAEGVIQAANFFNENIAQNIPGVFREVQDNNPVLRTVDNLIGGSQLLTNTPLTNIEGMIQTVEAYNTIVGEVERVYKESGENFLPGTKFAVELRGNQAYFKITAPEGSPTQVPLPPEIAKQIINRAYNENLVMKMYDEYTKSRN